jgi:hypothetical protein
MKTYFLFTSTIFALASAFSIAASAAEVEWCLIKDNQVFNCFFYKSDCLMHKQPSDSCVAMVKK